MWLSLPMLVLLLAVVAIIALLLPVPVPVPLLLTVLEGDFIVDRLVGDSDTWLGFVIDTDLALDLPADVGILKGSGSELYLFLFFAPKGSAEPPPFFFGEATLLSPSFNFRAI